MRSCWIFRTSLPRRSSGSRMASMRKLTLVLALFLGLSGSLSAAAASKEAERIRNAADVLKEIMGAADKGIPSDILQRSTCVAVVPSLKKGAFGIGGENGKGIVACRKENGGWGAPSMLAVT